MELNREYLVVSRRIQEPSQEQQQGLLAAWQGLAVRIEEERDLSLLHGQIGKQLVLCASETVVSQLRADFGDYLIIEKNEELHLR